MSKQKITAVAERELEGFLRENGYELYNIEFVKESKNWFLRIYIDQANYEDGKYISTDDCEKVSKYISAKLDELDLIEQNYYLEVSSPGLDRVLLKDEHYLRCIGKEVDIKLYKGKDGTKAFSGILKSFEAGQVTIVSAGGIEIKLDKEQISKTKLKIVF